jgi:hypothetical protein
MNYIARMARRTVTHLLPPSARTVRCSACAEPRDEQNPILSGPGVYLCRKCFDRITTSLAPRRPPVDAVRCHFCRHFRAPSDIGRAGAMAVCADCLGAMAVVFENAHEPPLDPLRSSSTR